MTSTDLEGRRRVVERSRERARRLRDEALAEYDPDPRVFDTWVIDPPPYFDDSFPESLDEQLDRWGGIASTITVEDGRVLCVDVGYKDGWETPGGDVERGARAEGAPRYGGTATDGSRDRGESLAGTAVRETKEETNIDVELTGVFYARDVDIDYGPPAPVCIPMVIFTAERVGGSRAVPAHTVPTGEPEIEDVGWFGPDELPANLTDRELIRESLTGECPEAHE